MVQQEAAGAVGESPPAGAGLCLLPVDYAAVKAAIHSGHDVNTANQHENSILHFACLYGHTKVVQLLVQAKADLNAANQTGQTGLHLASMKGHLDIVNLLTQAGTCHIDQPTKLSEMTALHLASTAGYADVCQHLLKAGADDHSLDLAEKPAAFYASNSATRQVFLRYGRRPPTAQLAPVPPSEPTAPAPNVAEHTAPLAVPEISQAHRESIASQISSIHAAAPASIQTQAAATDTQPTGDTQASKKDSSFAKEAKLDTSKQPSTGKPTQNASETSEKVKAVKHEPKTDADAQKSTTGKSPSDPVPLTDIPSASLEHKDRVEQKGETLDQRAQEELDPDAEARAKRKKEKRKKKKRKEKRRARELSPDRMADKMISSRITRSALGRGKSLQQNSEIESAYFTSKPPNWQEQLKNIKEMRKDRTAPVDIMMGWDRVCDPEAKPETIRYQVLISLLLSSATKDEVNVPAAMGRLKTAGCDVDSILKMSDKQLGELISPVGLWKNKVRYIKGTTKILQEKYEGDVPRTIDELCDLPGIGRKMAYLIMNCVWGRVLSIGVEAHVHRISNRLGWVSTWDTEETRRALQDWLPREHWRDIDVVLVGFGQTVCKPIFTMCDICLNQDICPSAFKKCLSKKSVKV